MYVVLFMLSLFSSFSIIYGDVVGFFALEIFRIFMYAMYMKGFHSRCRSGWSGVVMELHLRT